MRFSGLVMLAAMALPASAGAEHAWSLAASGGSVELLGVWGSSKSDVYAVSREGAILRSTDGGHSWTARTIAGAAAAGGLVSVYGRDENTVYVAGGAMVLRSTDHGATWITVYTGTSDDKFAGVFAVGGGEVIAVGAKGAIVHSADSGSTWERQNSNSTSDLNGVWGSSSQDLFVVGTGGALLRSEDAGATWTAQTPESGDEDLMAVWGASKTDVWVVGAGGSVLHSKDSGASWQTAHKWDRQLSSVWGTGKGEVYAIATTGGQFLHSPDGKKFAPVKSGVEGALHGVWAASPDEVFIAGENGVILHSPGKGAKSFEQRFGIKGAGREILTAVWGASPDDLYVVGHLENGAGTKPPHTGEIFHSADAGASWVSSFRSTGAMELHGVWGSGPANVFVVGEGGNILHSKDSGKSWETQKNLFKNTLRGVWGPSAEEVYAVGDKGRILHTRDGGKTWAAEKGPTTPAPIDFRGVFGPDKDHVYAIGQDEKTELVIVTSVDGGKTWKEAYRGPGGVTGGAGGLWGAGKADLWAYTESDGSELKILHSADEGKKWEPQAVGKGIVHGGWGPTATDAYLVTAGGEIQRTADGGKTWTDDKSGTVEALHGVWGTAPDNVFVVGDKGIILHSRAKP